MAIYEIPMPPSANALWRFDRATGRVLKSRAYRTWLEAASLSLLTQGRCLVPGPARVRVLVEGGKGFSAARDLDNLLKPILDLLCAANVLARDTARNVPRIEAEYAPGEGGLARCWVTVETIEEPSGVAK